MDPPDAADLDSRFTLDAGLVARRKAHNERRLHTVQIPAIRAAGFLILCGIALLQDTASASPPREPALAVLMALNLAYAVLGWVVLSLGHGRTGRLDLSLVLFHADIAVWLVNLHHLEPSNLFFAFFLLVRVADQVGFGFRRAFYFAHVIVLAYVGYALWIGTQDIARDLGPQRLAIAAVMYLLGLYLSATGVVIGRLRKRNRAAIQAARGLVENLEQKTQTLEAQALELEAARGAAEQASRAKSQFLAVISHEIRTPMNAVLGSTELLLGGNLDAEQRKLAKASHRAATALLALIDDVLDFSRIDARKLALHEVRVELAALAAEAVEVIEVTARDKPVTLALHVARGVPERVIADPVRLRQVLMNLLHNAMKFTDRGSVVLTIERVGGDLGTAWLRFAVRDSGIGIAPQQLDAVFEAFTQIDASSTRRHGGSGLGLAIVRRLVELMGGRVGAESRLGEGSTFWFELELRIAEGTPTPPELPAATPANVPAAQVLLAEDDPVNQLVVAGLLRHLGSEVDIVGDGAAAAEAALARHYDLVLMDLHMPRLDGFDATARIRAAERERGLHTPIVALTADALATDRERCLEAGMDDYVTKPVNGGVLAAVLARWAGRGTPALSQWAEPPG